MLNSPFYESLYHYMYFSYDNMNTSVFTNRLFYVYIISNNYRVKVIWWDPWEQGRNQDHDRAWLTLTRPPVVYLFLFSFQLNIEIFRLMHRMTVLALFYRKNFQRAAIKQYICFFLSSGKNSLRWLIFF